MTAHMLTSGLSAVWLKRTRGVPNPFFVVGVNTELDRMTDEQKENLLKIIPPPIGQSYDPDINEDDRHAVRMYLRDFYMRRSKGERKYMVDSLTGDHMNPTSPETELIYDIFHPGKTTQCFVSVNIPF